MLSLAELRRAVRGLETVLLQARLQRVVQLDDLGVVLAFYGRGEETNVLLSCRAGFARLSLIDDVPPAPASPPAFAQYLRAHLRGVRFGGARLLAEDRQAAIRLDGAEDSFDLVLSLLGARSNVYLLDAAGILLASLRPLAVTRRDLAIGQPWSNPGSSPPSEGDDRWAQIDDEDYLAAVEVSYAERENAAARDELLRRITHAIAKEMHFLERREGKLGEGLASASSATGGRRLGELLKGVLHTVQSGDTRAVVADYDTGEEIAIPLDPLLTPAKNLERLFSRYQKAQKATKALAQQIEDIRGRREKMAQLAEDLRGLGDAPGLDTLNSFAARAAVRQALARHRPASARAVERRGEPRVRAGARGKTERGKGQVPARLLPKVYETADGLEIWVGRSDEANDYLTTRLARGNDLFLHVEGAAGSHVVLRTGGRQDPPSTSILDACEIAVHFSKARGHDRADVHVAPIKDVKKPRHAKPGLVHVMRGKIVHLRRDRARLERVLGSRAPGAGVDEG